MRYTSMTITQATENLIKLMADKMAHEKSYVDAVTAKYNADSCSKLEQCETEFIKCSDALAKMDERISKADAELSDAYAAEGHIYMGATSSGEYNMYTYREIEREALRRFKKILEEDNHVDKK